MDWREEFWDFENRIYLDCANQGPFPKATLRAVQQALELKKYPERLTHEYYFELPAQTRTTLARLIGAHPTEIALTSGASDGVNAVATGLAFAPGEEILLPQREFPANYYPWKHLERRGVRVREVAPAAGPFVTADDLLAALSKRTRLVAASYVTYDTANRLDAARLCAECRRRGIYTFFDASQAVGSFPIDVKELGCDFLTSCGYKWLLSPYGTGFFYLREELIEKLEVHAIRWMAVEGAMNFNRLPREGWKLEPDARRWDVAEVSNFINLSAMKASLEFLLRVGVENIERHAVALCEQLGRQLPHDRLVLKSPRAPEHRGSFVVVAARSPERTRMLWERLREEKIFVSLREDGLRVGPHIYNREWEIDRLLAVLT
ncbi:MAG: aminotransferase class V-fold PLP-dependent enzyme, partial [Terriglobia bacterium]